MRYLSPLLLLAACSAEPPTAASQPEQVGQRELLGIGQALGADARDVALDDRWAAIAVDGAVRIWHLDPTTGAWTEQDPIPAPEGAEGFGGSIHLSGDRLAVSAPREDVAFEGSTVADAGAVYVYDHDEAASCGSSWCLDGRLVAATPESSDLLGVRDAVVVDGDRILVGARAEGPDNSGAAFVFDRDDTGATCGATWCQTQRLAPVTGSDAYFGSHVDLEGDRLVVGADIESEVYVYDRDPGGTVCGDPWCLTQQLVGSGVEPGDLFASVALSGDWIAVGAPNDDTAASNAGAVYVFERNASGTDCNDPWCQQDLIPNPVAGSGDRFGRGVDLEGGTLAVGRELGAVAGHDDAGDVRLFEVVDGSWTEAGVLVPVDPSLGSGLGHRVVIDGVRALASGESNRPAVLWELFPRGPGLLVDPTPLAAAVGGGFTASDYPTFSAGIHDGFGGAFGVDSRLRFDASECGDLVIAHEAGGRLNDHVVLYLDTDGADGGFTTTEGFTDVDDPLRRAISGYDGVKRSVLEFAPGFTADVAIAWDAGSAGAWSLREGEGHAFLVTADRWDDFSGDPRLELGFALSDLGLEAGQPFDLVGTYVSSTAYRSNEFHGVDASTVPADNIAWDPLALDEGDFLTVQPVVPRGPSLDGAAGLAVDEGGTASVEVVDPASDPSGIDPGSLEVATQGDHGTASVADGALVYTHDGSEDATVDAFTYLLADACGATSTGTVEVTITPVDDPAEVSVPDVVFEPSEDVATAVPAIAVSDPDSEVVAVRLTVTHGSLSLDTAGLSVVAGAVGTSSVELAGSLADLATALGTLTYTGDADFDGTDTLAVAVDDSGTVPATPEAAGSLHIDVQPVDDPPAITTNTGFSVDEGASHALSPSELDGSDVDDPDTALRFVLVTGPTEGVVTVDGTELAADGTFTLQDLADGDVAYVHSGSETTSDGFEVQLEDDADHASPVVEVSVAVNSVDDPPVAYDDAYTVDQGATLEQEADGGVLANDTDPEGDALAASPVDDVSHGTLVLSADGSFTYTPDADYTGSDSFTYRATAAGLDSEPATVSLTVTPVDDPPDTGDPDTGDPDTGDPDDTGCGCSSAPAPASLLALLPLALVVRRRRG